MGDNCFGARSLRIERTLPSSESSEGVAESAAYAVESELLLPTDDGRYACDADACDNGDTSNEGEEAERLIDCACT